MMGVWPAARIHVSALILAIAQKSYYDGPWLKSPCYYRVWSHIHCNNSLGFKPFSFHICGTVLSLRRPRFYGHSNRHIMPEGGCPMKKRQSFTKEFKLEAVRLMEHGNKSAAEVARELGIRR